MSPLSTPEQQQAFITEVRRFHRRALAAILVSYLLLFAFVIVGVDAYFRNQTHLQEASCTGRLSLRATLRFAELRSAQLAASQPQTPALVARAKVAEKFYRDAIRNIDISDCAGVHLAHPLNTRGGSP